MDSRLGANNTEIFRRKDGLMLRKTKSIERAFHLLASLPTDFMVERQDNLPQERAGLCVSALPTRVYIR